MQALAYHLAVWVVGEHGGEYRVPASLCAQTVKRTYQGQPRGAGILKLLSNGRDAKRSGDGSLPGIPRIGSNLQVSDSAHHQPDLLRFMHAAREVPRDASTITSSLFLHGNNGIRMHDAEQRPTSLSSSPLTNLDSEPAATAMRCLCTRYLKGAQDGNMGEYLWQLSERLDPASFSPASSHVSPLPPPCPSTSYLHSTVYAGSGLSLPRLWVFSQQLYKVHPQDSTPLTAPFYLDCLLVGDCFFLNLSGTGGEAG